MTAHTAMGNEQFNKNMTRSKNFIFIQLVVNKLFFSGLFCLNRNHTFGSCVPVSFFLLCFNCKPVVVNHETFSHDANEPFFVHAAVSVSDIHMYSIKRVFCFCFNFLFSFSSCVLGGRQTQ